MKGDPHEITPARRHAIMEHAHLVSAMEYLVEALTPEPGAASALRLGAVARGVPLRWVQAAKVRLGIEEYRDRYGITMWRLGETS